MDYLKSISRGFWKQGQAEGTAELLLGLAFILSHSTDMASCWGRATSILWWLGGLAATLIYSTGMALFWGKGSVSCCGGPEGKGFLR